MRTSNKDDDDKQGGLLIPGYHYISPSNSADRIPSPERAAFYRAFGWGMEWISGGWMKSLWTKGLETQTTHPHQPGYLTDEPALGFRLDEMAGIFSTPLLER
ncbi:hypothetical protein GX48_01790 [Paracoccidioides brasiliensis]|nr:hypothetical protein GX48_01790 [Paracoccidioides brasiliensis]